MEKATAVNTCLGVLMGRDCIYLDQVKQDALNNLTFTGDIDGHLISQHRDEKDWFPYTLTFRRVLGDQMAIDVPRKGQIVQSILFHLIQIDAVPSLQNT